MPTRTADWVGLTLDGRYAVTAKLGEGGMGLVYRAKDARLNCDVVVKVPRAAMLEYAGFRRRFKDEVGALVKLAHPHVVKVTDFGQHDGVPFAVMQFLQAGSLEDRRPKDADGHPKAVAPRSLEGWLLPVAEALDFIHKQGYVHRDVKPANILFDAYKNAYISDFGVAKAVAGNKSEGTGITGAGLVLGTPTYMAPELATGEPFDGRIDQYALAITVYELLAGRPPFDGPPMTVLIKHKTEIAPALATARPGTSAGISAAIAKALSKDPAQRYPTCAAFAKVVLAAVAQTAPVPVAQAAGTPKRETPRGGVKVTTAEGLPIAAIVADNGLAFAQKRMSNPKSGNRTGLMVALAVVSVLLTILIGVGIWLGTRGSDSASRERPESSSQKSATVEVKPPVTDVPGSPKVTELRSEPSTIELLAGGPWVSVDISIERTGTGPVTVELAAPFGVEVKQAAVTIEASEPARFELKAAAGAVPTAGMSARFTVRGTTVRQIVPVTLKRLDFQASLASPSEVVLSAGQKNVVELRIDRAGGYAGPLTLTVPASAMLKGITVHVPAGAETATVPIVAVSAARPGGAVIRIGVAAADGGASHDLPVTVRITPVVEVQAFIGHSGTVHAVSLSADGKLALSGGADGTVRLWDVTTGQQKWKGEGHSSAVLTVAFSHDGNQLVSGGADKTVRLWDATGTARTFSVAGLADPGHTSAVWLVRFDDAKIIRSVSADKTIHWVAASGKPRQVPDGRRDLILGQKYKNDVTAGYELSQGIAIPGDSGEFLVAGVGGPIATLLRRGANDKVPPQPVAHTPKQPGPFKLIAAAGDGSRLLTIGEDNGVRLWDTRGVPMAAARVAKAFPEFPWPAEYDVTCAVLDGDGRHALLGGADGTLKLWRLQ
jgi:serine/threonine protein kinase